MNNLSLLVVGGGSGLGALLVDMAIEAGATAVGIIDVNAEATSSVLSSVKQAGVPCVSAIADIRTRESVTTAFSEVTEAIGRIDTVINSAAIYPRKPLLEIGDADWDASNAINIKGTYHCTVAAIAHMKNQAPRGHVRGRIVNITSVDAFKAHPQNAHYAATKAAVVSLTRSFAHEVAPHGILVNSVAPAGMATEKARESGFLTELAAASPLGRGGEPKEMAEWVLMAGGPRNTYMTGENIIVSGGYIYA